jgi:hypothetical protein
LAESTLVPAGSQCRCSSTRLANESTDALYISLRICFRLTVKHSTTLHPILLSLCATARRNLCSSNPPQVMNRQNFGRVTFLSLRTKLFRGGQLKVHFGNPSRTISYGDRSISGFSISTSESGTKEYASQWRYDRLRVGIISTIWTSHDLRNLTDSA